MSTFMSRIQTAGTDTARHNANQEELTVSQIVNFDADPGGGAFLVAVPSFLNDKELVRVTLGPIPAADTGNPVRATATIRGTGIPPVWYLEFLAAQDFYDNLQPPLQDQLNIATPGPIAPTPTIVLDGPALAAFAAGISGRDVPATLVYRPRFSEALDQVNPGGSPDFWSWAQGTTLRDDAIATVETHLRDLEAEIFGGRSIVELGTTAAGPVTLRSCGYAALDRRGVVWIQPGDTGNGAGQIPPLAASNTAASLRLHPAAFWTAAKCGNHRTIGQVAERQRPIDDLAGAPLVLLIFDPVRASRWLFVHDNTPITGLVIHPAGSDIRRPRDIWNQIIVPAIASSEVGGGLMLYDGDPQSPVPRIELGDLARLTFAHFLQPYGSSPQDPYGIFVQT